MKIAKVNTRGKKGTEISACKSAKKRGLPLSGYRPKGSECEFEDIKETPFKKEEQSVIWNARDSHATLVIGPIENSPMSELSYEVAETFGRPVLISESSEEIIKWLSKLGEELTLNITGPNEEEDEKSSLRAKKIMEKVLAHFDATLLM